MCSGQIISAHKSTLYSGSIPQPKLNLFIQLLGFQHGVFPFNYLGVPIFKGKPKLQYLQPIADRIKSKLAAWKASLLSISSIVQLIKFVIQGMLVHIISFYDWPVSLIKEIEQSIRNFIWSGDTSKRKLVTVSWKKVCRPVSERGLGIRSISCTNQASNLKLCWEMLTSDNSWAKILHSRVIKKDKVINYHIFSSIWSSIKSEYNNLLENTKWLLGNGESISFWKDQWCGNSLNNVLNIPNSISMHLAARVSDFIHNFQWKIPQAVSIVFPNISSLVNQVIIPVERKKDKLVWINSSKGDLTLKDAYLHKSPIGQNNHWAKIVWSPDIPPFKSLTVW